VLKELKKNAVSNASGEDLTSMFTLVQQGYNVKWHKFARGSIS